ncbi:MAG: hypothetical protein ORN21_01775 [Methylophilaceae bacterium]|nr:hypothetical protein [Methylophilaceae bacterium]
MKCKASATQEAIPINEIGEPPSSAPPSHSPVQTVLQRFLFDNNQRVCPAPQRTVARSSQ